MVRGRKKSRGKSTRDLALAALASGKRRREVEEEEKDAEKDGGVNEGKEQLVFEDPYDDEFESEDEEGADDDDSDADVEMMGEERVKVPEGKDGKRVFLHGKDELQPGEVLVYDRSAYDMLHQLNAEWPCLSFDVVRGWSTGTYPLMFHMVAGSQADQKGKNKLVVCKLGNLVRTRRKPRKSEDSEHEDEESSSDSDSEQGDCTLNHQDVPHDGVVNRVRSMPQRPGIISSWSETGKVHIFDVESCLETLNRGARMTKPGAVPSSKIKPFYSFAGHSEEGFAMDWSRCDRGKLVTGDCRKDIFLWELREDDSTFEIGKAPFSGHQNSVEDLQWSPSEATVFASCSVDRSIRFWDIRERRKAALSIPDSHGTDINVISWNPIDSHLLVSGCDAGKLRVWDLRTVKSSNSTSQPAADFHHHQKAITSVEWHPKESSMLAASSDDHSVSIWDLAVERDPDEELRLGTVYAGSDEVPPQLMFIHMGQTFVKEIHWHPDIPSMLVSTAQDGFNVFCASDIF